MAAEAIGPVLPSESIVVNKSTVPVGSTRVVEQALRRDDVRVVSNPEFLREGSAVHDFLNPDRIVIGAEDQAAAGRVAALFSALKAPVLVTDPASAETIKYASNAFLATKVSFVNAIANVCEVVGADVREVVLGMGYDKRIGFEFLKPGPGWGGSCFPKDSRALVRIAEEAGYDFGLLRGVIDVNNAQFERVADKVARIKFPDKSPGFGIAEGREGTPSHGIGVSPDGKSLWVNSTFANSVFAYSLPELRLIGSVELPEVHPLGRAPSGAVPEWITFTADSKVVYVSNSGAKSVTAIDISTLKIVALIPVGEVPKRLNTLVLH